MTGRHDRIGEPATTYNLNISRRHLDAARKLAHARSTIGHTVYISDIIREAVAAYLEHKNDQT